MSQIPICRRLFISGFLMFVILFPRLAPAQPNGEKSHVYPNPGIVAFRGGKWVGSDHLYNLTDKIDIVVEIFKPGNIELPFTEEMIRSRIRDIFIRAKIKPEAENVSGKPPLPFFHFLIMIYPIDQGYVAYCGGRLMEQIHLDRIRLDEQTALQGITWESENLIVVSKKDLESQLDKSIDEIANTFVERYLFYQKIKSQIQKQ